MCGLVGICGKVNFDRNKVVNQMISQLSHRGPDNINYFQANGELPNTIPEYSLTKVDIVSGNFLWIGLGFLLLYVGISSFFEKDEPKDKD